MRLFLLLTCQKHLFVFWHERRNKMIYPINHIVNGVGIPIRFQLFMDGILTFESPVGAHKTILIIHEILNARCKLALSNSSPLSMRKAIRYAFFRLFSVFIKPFLVRTLINYYPIMHFFNSFFSQLNGCSTLRLSKP